MRIALRRFRAETDDAEQFLDALRVSPCWWSGRETAAARPECPPHSARVERGIGVLEHHLMRFSQRADVAERRCRDVMSVEQDLSASGL